MVRIRVRINGASSGRILQVTPESTNREHHSDGERLPLTPDLADGDSDDEDDEDKSEGENGKVPDDAVTRTDVAVAVCVGITEGVAGATSKPSMIWSV